MVGYGLDGYSFSRFIWGSCIRPEKPVGLCDRFLLWHRARYSGLRATFYCRSFGLPGMAAGYRTARCLFYPFLRLRRLRHHPQPHYLCHLLRTSLVAGEEAFCTAYSGLDAAYPGRHTHALKCFFPDTFLVASFKLFNRRTALGAAIHIHPQRHPSPRPLWLLVPAAQKEVKIRRICGIPVNVA